MKTLHINGKELKLFTVFMVKQVGATSAEELFSAAVRASNRFIKLSHEFKAGDLYKLYSSSHSQASIIPELDDSFVAEFKQKFNKAAVSSGEALRYITLGNVDTVTLKSLTSSALSDLNTLKEISMQNVNVANSLFEKSLYDTNVHAVADGVAAVLTLGFSLFISSKLSENNEFTSKLGREIEDFNQITSLVSELETYIPHE